MHACFPRSLLLLVAHCGATFAGLGLIGAPDLAAARAQVEDFGTAQFLVLLIAAAFAIAWAFAQAAPVRPRLQRLVNRGGVACSAVFVWGVIAAIALVAAAAGSSGALVIAAVCILASVWWAIVAFGLTCQVEEASRHALAQLAAG